MFIGYGDAVDFFVASESSAALVEYFVIFTLKGVFYVSRAVAVGGENNAILFSVIDNNGEVIL